MMKIVASLVILGLCANVCFAQGATPVSSTNGATAFSSSWLNSSATKVYDISNSTDALNWNSASTATAVAGVPATNVIFGAGASNDTSYVYGIVTDSSTDMVTKIVKRTVNNTIVGWLNDTVEASVIATDSAITTTIVADSGAYTAATGPGYLALLTQGSDGTNNQVYVTILSGTSPSSTKITSTLDIVTATTTTTQGCTTTTYGIGNIWYDKAAGAFFYTYWKLVESETAPAAAGDACTTTPAASSPTVYTIGLGGIYVNGTAYWTAPLSLATATAANAVSNVIGGPDNWLNATNIFVIYLDSTAAGTGTGATGVTYSSKTTKAITTTTGGSFSALATNSISGTVGDAAYVETQFTPAAVWASNFTYGITVSNYTQSGATPAESYTYTNYLNGTATATDSGLSSSSAVAAGAFYGWQLNTGFTLVASFETATSVAWVAGTWYANGTVNATATTIATLVSPVSFYEDVNGTNWVGWTDYDTSANALTYAGYLAKFQGQLNVPTGASILSALSAFVALFLAAIFVF